MINLRLGPDNNQFGPANHQLPT